MLVFKHLGFHSSEENQHKCDPDEDCPDVMAGDPAFHGLPHPLIPFLCNDIFLQKNLNFRTHDDYGIDKREEREGHWSQPKIPQLIRGGA